VNDPRRIGMISERAGSDHDETTAPEPRAGLQGEGGRGGHQRREDAGRAGPAVRCACEQIAQWRAQLLDGASDLFGDSARAQAVPTVDVKTLHAKIGELTRKSGFLSGVLGSAGLLASAKR
jgi:hypothetical protein